MAAEKKKADGNTAFQNGEFDKAIQLYSEAIELDDLNHVLYANRAAAYLAKKDFESARSDCKKCLSLDDTFVKAYLRLATAEKGLGNKVEALKVCRQGMQFFDQKANKKNARKSGLSDFKKLEKELKAEVDPPVPSSRNRNSAVEQAIRSGGNSGQEAQDLGQKVIAAQYQSAQIRTELVSKRNEKTRKQIILKNLEEEVSGATATYRSMGKGFLLQDSTKIIADMRAEEAKLDSDIQNLTKGAMVLDSKIKDSQRALEEYFKRNRN